MGRREARREQKERRWGEISEEKRGKERDSGGEEREKE